MAFLLAVPVALGPLLLGSVDLWVQTAIFVLLASGTVFWCWSRLQRHDLPIPNRSLAAWLLALAILGGISCLQSPLRFYAVCGWRVWLVGLWVIAATVLIDEPARDRIDQGLEGCAWILVVWSCYQMAVRHSRYVGIPGPFASLLNPNILAGAILLFLPVAVKSRDWLLCAGLLWVLAWTRCLGAWLGLVLALALYWRRTGFFGFLSQLGIAVVVLGALIFKLQSPRVFNRWYWWQAASHMVFVRPWLGFGPGTFSYVLPVYWDVRRPLLSLYAHEHFLEVAIEFGWPFLFVWLAGIVYFLNRSQSGKSVGVTAILFQSLIDYPLSIPAVFWLFCYSLAAGQDVRAVPKDSAALDSAFSRIAAGAAAAVVGLALAYPALTRWQSSRLEAIALESFKASAQPASVVALLDRASYWHANPEADRLAAEVVLGRGELGPDGQRFDRAAAYLERSVALNPYRPSSWTMLAQTYAASGRSELARKTLDRGALYCPILR